MPIFSSTKDNEKQSITKPFADNIKKNKSHFYCIDYCFDDFEHDMNNKEKLCLAKCSDNLHVYYSLNYDRLVKLKSFI